MDRTYQKVNKLTKVPFYILYFNLATFIQTVQMRISVMKQTIFSTSPTALCSAIGQDGKLINK